MKVMVIGTRGIPDYLGGVETHCQELYPRLVNLGCDITVIRRSSYRVSGDQQKEFMGVKLVDVFSPNNKSLEAIVHTIIAICYARLKSPDLLHIHAIGPSLLVPFARLLGLKVVSTNHGPDYDRQKWGKFAKTTLKLGERLGAKFSNKVIAISTVIQDILEEKYDIESELVFNGIAPQRKQQPSVYLNSLGLSQGQYIVAVGRFVEEKGFHDLIAAFEELEESNVKLVLVGDSDHEDKYSLSLKKMAIKDNIVMTGFINGDKLTEVFCNAKLFTMPSYHEGLPIALLEAMSYELPVLVSDIPANMAIELNENDYFAVGNVHELSIALGKKLKNGDRVDYSKYLLKYDWDLIANQTLGIYESVSD